MHEGGGRGRKRAPAASRAALPLAAVGVMTCVWCWPNRSSEFCTSLPTRSSTAHAGYCATERRQVRAARPLEPSGVSPCDQEGQARPAGASATAGASASYRRFPPGTAAELLCAHDRCVGTLRRPRRSRCSPLCPAAAALAAARHCRVHCAPSCRQPCRARRTHLATTTFLRVTRATGRRGRS